MYLRHNVPQEFMGDLRGISQSTVSRIVTKLVPIVKSVLEECVPTAEDAIEMVRGRVCLVDGTITPCWSYADHTELWSYKRGITGFNTQLISLLDGDPVFISDPLPGRTHDAAAINMTPVTEIVRHSGGGIADKGYQGCGLATPRKAPPNGELGKRDKECNAEISALRAPIERVIAHFKSWRIFHTDYRRPYSTYREAYDATRGLFFFSIIWGFE
jgi:transposase